jgi:hypothetical protein
MENKVTVCAAEIFSNGSGSLICTLIRTSLHICLASSQHFCSGTVQHFFLGSSQHLSLGSSQHLVCGPCNEKSFGSGSGSSWSTTKNLYKNLVFLNAISSIFFQKAGLYFYFFFYFCIIFDVRSGSKSGTVPGMHYVSTIIT